MTGVEEYEEFNGLILTAYEIRPEAYLPMFRNARKRPADTYLSYVLQLRVALNKWAIQLVKGPEVQDLSENQSSVVEGDASQVALLVKQPESNKSLYYCKHVGSSATHPSDTPDMNHAGEKEDSDSSCVEGVLVPPEVSGDHIVVPETLESASEEEELHHSSQDIVSAGALASNKDVTPREGLHHLTSDRCEELASQLSTFSDVFGDSPGLPTWAVHNIDVGDCKPIKLPPTGLTLLDSLYLMRKLHICWTTVL
ncbi:hypothetical protein Pcinc_009777 [Petrolisthes cinctipes]|uniref:Uncharacterized protein n=1 Tax=Petrolisthes cinctipes TaxID=88211 RepID=A0AAE1KV50_PETCI|nr:hypothetical protein Pcinc_009777 [Petrolisthes cinctipes]